MPAIVFFVVLIKLLVFERILDFLHIPKSRYTYAKVIVKDTVGRNMGTGTGMGMNRALFDMHRATFEYGNFQIIELIIPKKTYNSISVGSRGVLVHTDSRFRGFHADKKITDIIKEKPRKSNKRRKSTGWRKD